MRGDSIKGSMSIATSMVAQGRSIAIRFAALPIASLTLRLVGCTRLTAVRFFAWLHFYDAHCASSSRQRNLRRRTARMPTSAQSASSTSSSPE